MSDTGEPRLTKSARKIVREGSHCNGELQFKYTNMWNSIASRFREEMPTKKHRKQLTFYENSFTGKEAVDFLHKTLPSMLAPGKEVTRESSASLLQKFADQRLFRNPRSDADKVIFQDNATLYVWNGDTTLNGLSQTPVRVRRANSFNAGSGDRPRRSAAFQQPLIRVDSPPETWKKFEIPSEAPKHKSAKNRRLSSSTGNLNLIGLDPRPHSPFGVHDQQETIKEEPEKEKGETKLDKSYMNRKPPTPTLVRVSPGYANIMKQENDENDYDFVSFRRRIPTHGHQTPAKISRRGMNSIAVPTKKSIVSRLTPSRFKSQKDDDKENSPPPVPPKPSMIEKVEYASVKVRPGRMMTEMDEWSHYSNELMKRLKAVLQVQDLSFVSWPVNGQHIKWICCEHDAYGVVKPMVPADDWPRNVKTAMTYLESFPFHQTHVNIAKLVENQEADVFKSVVAQLKHEGPIFTSQFGIAVLRVVNHFKRITSGANSHPVQTDFSSYSPTTRLLLRGSYDCTSVASHNSSHYSLEKSHYATPSSFISQSKSISGSNLPYIDNGMVNCSISSQRTPPHAPVRVHPTSGMKARNIFVHPSNMDQFLRLPGLKHSPELLESIKKSVSGGSIGLNGVSPCTAPLPRRANGVMIEAESLLQGISPDLVHSLFEALQLLLITLPTGTYRRLHSLITFINAVSSNHCLHLHQNTDYNRYVVLEALCDCVLASNCPSGPLGAPSSTGYAPLTPMERLLILTLLVDNDTKLFHIPESLTQQVEEAINKKKREKVVFDDESPSSRPAPQYCDRVNSATFNEEGCTETEKGLLNLLDQYVKDERMGVSERDRRLRKFEKEYPAIFSIRFPDGRNEKKSLETVNRFMKLFRNKNE